MKENTCISDRDRELYNRFIPWHPHAAVTYRPYDKDHSETVMFINHVDFSREWPLGDKLWDPQTIMTLILSYLRKNELIGSTDTILTSIPVEGTGSIKIHIKWEIVHRAAVQAKRSCLDVYCLHFTMNALTKMIDDGLFTAVEEKSSIVGYRFQPFQITNLVEDLEIEGKIKIEHSERPGL